MFLYNFSLPEGDFSLSPDSSPPLGKDAEGHTMTVAPRDTATYDQVRVYGYKPSLFITKKWQWKHTGPRHGG